MPSLDAPNSGHDPPDVLPAAAELPVAPPIAPFVDPNEADWPTLQEPSDEPLIDISHDRIAVLGCYRAAGWLNAASRTLLRSGAAERLYRAAEHLPVGWGLGVFDAWRPLDLQIELFEAAYADPELPPGFVAKPSSDPLTPPPHLTGGTVDVTLTYDGVELALGTPFDDFTDRAHTRAFEDQDSVVRSLRRVLHHSMTAEGFVSLDCEWWHFEFGTRRWAAMTDEPALYGAAFPDDSEPT